MPSRPTYDDLLNRVQQLETELRRFRQAALQAAASKGHGMARSVLPLATEVEDQRFKAVGQPDPDPQARSAKVQIIPLHQLSGSSEPIPPLEQSEASVKSIVRAAPVGIGIARKRVFVWVSEQLKAMLGYQDEELIGQSARMLYASDEEFERTGVGRYKQMDRFGIGEIETQWRCRSGAVIDVQLRSTPLDPRDLSKGVIFAALDITQRKQAERALKQARDHLESEVAKRTSELTLANLQLRQEREALRKSEERYRSLVERMNDGVTMLDRQSRINYANPSFAKMVGMPISQILGQRFDAFVIEADQALFGREWQRRQKGAFGLYELKLKHSAGGEIFASIASKPTFDSDGQFNGSFGIVTDITQTKLLQHQLLRSERLAATGQLAASIAHEINSPLQGITSLLSVIKHTRQKDQELVQQIDLIKGAFDSIRLTVRKLLDLNRPGKEKMQSIDLNAAIKDTMALMQTHLKKYRIRLKLELADAVPVVMASPQQLGQLFMNLVNNAVDAMIGEARSRLPHAAPGGSQGEITITSRTEGKQVVITVADTGPGIPPEALQHIFDPFYTRKKTIGMGVGLSICSGILEDHKGTIEAMNKPGGGALFRIALPVVNPVQ